MALHYAAVKCQTTAKRGEEEWLGLACADGVRWRRLVGREEGEEASKQGKQGNWTAASHMDGYGYDSTATDAAGRATNIKRLTLFTEGY